MKNNKTSTFIVAIFSIILGLFIGGLILLFAGYNPIQAYTQMIVGVFSKPKYISWMIVRATPLIFTGLAVAFAFQTGLFNIGAEGQFIVGTIVAVLAGYLVELPPIIHPIFVFTVAVIAAGLWGGIAGFLKARFGIHEVIATIMLNWIALYLRNYVVGLPRVQLKSNISHSIHPTASIMIGEGWKTTKAGQTWAKAHPLLGEYLKAPANWGIIIAIVTVIVIWFILNKTTLGYQLRAVGSNQYAAEHAGINVNRNIMMSMGISGMLAGAAGALHVMGVSKNISTIAVMEGYGFDGIAVALIGSNTPIGSLLGGLLFGTLKYGGTKIQSPPVNAPSEVINIVIGIIVFFIATPKLIKIIKDIYKRGEKNA